MPTFAKQLSFFFLIVVVSSTCYHQIQARESKFFSKYLHQLSTTNYLTIPSTHPKVVPLSSPTPSPSPITSQIGGIPASAPIGADSVSAPAPAPITSGADYNPAPAPATLGADYSPGPGPAPFENDIPYYGLYAKGTNYKEDVFSTEDPEEFNNRESYTYNNNGYSNSLSNNNGFLTSNQESYHNTNNGYESEPQGMSDTRFQNDGKYYHDVEQENHSPTGYENNNDEEGYYGGNYNKSKYEFDSIEEYEKQEGFGDVQQEFIP